MEAELVPPLSDSNTADVKTDNAGGVVSGRMEYEHRDMNQDPRHPAGTTPHHAVPDTVPLL